MSSYETGQRLLHYVLVIASFTSGSSMLLEGLGLAQIPDIMTTVSRNGVNRVEFITYLFGWTNIRTFQILAGLMLVSCGFSFYVRSAEKYTTFMLMHYYIFLLWITIQMDEPAIEGWVFAFLTSIKLVMQLLQVDNRQKKDWIKTSLNYNKKKETQ